MRSVRLALRLTRIALTVALALASYVGRRALAGRLSAHARERLRGDVLARALERLGATFVKLGQILSTRPDLLGPGYVETLARLQDRVPPTGMHRLEAVLAAELTAEARRRLVFVDPAPVAAASVAEVHRGRLDTGEQVAVKVQRPDAPAQIDRDLTLMRAGARLVELLPSFRLLSLAGAVDRFAEALRLQLDFRREAENNRRFAESLADVEGVRVPRLHPDLCTARVLVMEWVEGVRATEPENVGGDRATLARRGYDLVLRMVFRDGFVHADMHPGNILLTPSDDVVLIDLGLVAEIPPDLLRPWCQTFAAIAQRDGAELARLFYVYAPSVATRDYEAYEAEVVRFFEEVHGKALGDLEIGATVAGAMGILRRHAVQIDPVFTVVNIAMLVAEGLGKQLDPTLDPVALATPYLVRALVEAPEGKAPLRDRPPPTASPEARSRGARGASV